MNTPDYKSEVAKGEVKYLLLQEHFEFEILFLQFCVKGEDAPYSIKVDLSK